MTGGKGWPLKWQIGDQSNDPQRSTKQANCKYGDQNSGNNNYGN